MDGDNSMENEQEITQIEKYDDLKWPLILNIVGLGSTILGLCLNIIKDVSPESNIAMATAGIASLSSLVGIVSYKAGLKKGTSEHAGPTL